MLRGDLSHFVVCLKNPSFSSSFKKRRVDEVLGLFGLDRRDALRHFVDSVADALYIGLAAFIGHLEVALVSRFEDLRIAGF